MDPFLRRVVEQREREQEAAVLVADVTPTKCRICRKSIKVHDGSTTTVCSPCGGVQKQRRLERLDRLNAAATRRTTHLLALAGIPKEPSMPESTEAVRICPTPGCGKRLRSNNTRRQCSNCAAGVKAHLGGEGRSPGQRKATSADVRKQFRALTQALSIDGDGLIDAFCRGWMDNLRSKVQPTDADEYRLSGDDA